MRNTALLAAVAAMTAGTIAPSAAEAHRRGYSHDHRNSQYYEGRSYRPRCRSGTTAAIVGAAAGALLGREVIGRRNKTTGTILGAAGGGLLGRELTRDKRCR